MRADQAAVAAFGPLAGVLRVVAVRFADVNALEGQVRVPAAEARDIRVDLPKKTLEVASVASNDGALALKRGRDGTVELPRLASGAETSAATTYGSPR